MIPFAVLSGLFLMPDGQTKEVRILDLAPDGFTFRLADPLPDPELPDSPQFKITLHFYDFENSCFRELTFSDFHLEKDAGSSSDFYTVYRLTTDNPRFRESAAHLAAEYLRYVELKSEQDDARVSQTLTGYPADLEDRYPESFDAQKRAWFTEASQTSDFLLPEVSSCELALSLDRPSVCERYLTLPLSDFIADFWSRNYLTAHPLAGKEVNCLYFGNQFCHLLFPELPALIRLLDKALRENVTPVVVFSYVQEHRLEACGSLLEALAVWCLENDRPLELVVNDWGMLSMIRDRGYSCFRLTLGVLLAKRRKDVRLPYKRGFSPEDYNETSLQAPFYQEYLREHFHIDRISYESCGYSPRIAPGSASLHIPFYQMNTSQFCTLYAACQNGGRGNQCAVFQCPEYCRDRAFLYPEFLHMVGRYNSLFGYDKDVLTDPERIRSFIAQGGRRIVAEFL